MPSLNTGNAILSNAIAVNSSYNVGIGGAASGTFKLDVNGSVNLAGNVTTTGAQFVQNGFYLANANAGATAFYTNMWGADDGVQFALRNLTGGARFIFQSAASYNYTFPATTGTLALTSNLSAYLPLTGGTLTGALSGTSASFSSSVTANGLYANAGNSARFYRSANDYYWGINNDSNNYLNFGTFAANGTAYGTNPKMMLLDNGNIGIGTSDVTNIGANYTALNINGATGYGAGIILKVNNVLQSQLYVENALTTLNIANGAYTITGGFGTAFRILSGGNVLIGTTSNSTGSPTFHIQNKNGLVASIAGFNFCSTTTAENGNNNLLVSGAYFNGTNAIATQTSSSLYQQFNGNHVFYGNVGLTPGSSYTGSEKLRITSDGNVGIGTSTPLALLHIQAAEPTFRITDSSDGGVMFIGNSGGYSYIRPFSRDFRFINAAGVSMLTIASNSQATFASSITTPSYVQSGVNIAINSSTATTLALVDCAMLLIRDASNGGSCICFFEIGTISIISQSGATTFTTSAPSANQIQLGVGAGSRSVTALGGSNRNGTQVRIGVFRNDGQ